MAQRARRLKAGSILCLLLVSLGLTFFAFTPIPHVSAANRTGTVDSYSSVTDPANVTICDDNKARFVSSDAWLNLDFGALLTNVTHVYVEAGPKSQSGGNIRLAISEDNSTWTSLSVSSIAFGAEETFTHIIPPDVSLRFVNITVSVGTAAHWFDVDCVRLDDDALTFDDGTYVYGKYLESWDGTDTGEWSRYGALANVSDCVNDCFARLGANPTYQNMTVRFENFWNVTSIAFYGYQQIGTWNNTFLVSPDGSSWVEVGFKYGIQGPAWFNFTYSGLVKYARVWARDAGTEFRWWSVRIVSGDAPGDFTVRYYFHTGISGLAVNGTGVSNGSIHGYVDGTLINLESTPDTDYSFWRYLIGVTYHTINPYGHTVTESTTVHSYASGGSPVTAQALNWWLLLLGFIMFVSPPFILAKRWHREAANIVILLFVMVMGLSFMMAGIS